MARAVVVGVLLRACKAVKTKRNVSVACILRRLASLHPMAPSSLRKRMPIRPAARQLRLRASWTVAGAATNTCGRS